MATFLIRNGRRRLRVRYAWAALCVGTVMLAAVHAALRLVPLPAGLDRPPAPSLLLTDREGRTLREQPVDGHYARPAVPIAQIPTTLRQATVAAEDRRFYTHGGVDFLAALRALGSQIGLRRAGDRRSGGSTITEQLIKLAEPRPRTLRAKILEAVQAWRLEQVWDKDRILAAYLNRLDYGNLNVGCVQAARGYFGKPLADLSPAECAFLAALPQSPTRLNPYRHPERIRHRQAWVLARMAAGGNLPPDALARALAEAPRLCPRARPFEAPHFTSLLLAQRSRAALAGAGEGSGEVRTTLDLELNRFRRGQPATTRRRVTRGTRRQRRGGRDRQPTRGIAGPRRLDGFLRAARRPDRRRPGAAFAGIDGQAVHLSAGLRAGGDPVGPRGRSAVGISRALGHLPARKLQSPLLRPDAFASGTGEFAEHLGRQGAGRPRRGTGGAPAASA